MDLNQMNLTTLEAAALNAMNEESAANGHDFGLLEEVQWSGSRKQLGALVTTLQAKGVVVEVDYTKVDGRTITQYVLAKEVQA